MFPFQRNLRRVDLYTIACRRQPTKRKVVIVPTSLLFFAEIMLQDLCCVGLTLDQKVSVDVERRWQSWRSRIQLNQNDAANITTTNDLQHHVFYDASEPTLATVAYWCVASNDGVELAFIDVETKCEPL